MEITQSEFHSKLLDILDHISNSAFITFDLEMSGITTNPKHDRAHDVVKPTLQQQYDSVRSAAETYQILQLGITAVEEERERDFYLARPYNFNLSPLSCRGVEVGLQRTISLSSSACDFLSKNGFNFGKVFVEGIPYLSRAEEAELRLENSLRVSKLSNIPYIEIKPDDTKALEFYEYARTTITDWITKPEQDYINIGAEMDKLNGFQRRLVHQLVRKEFPGHRTFARCDGDFMQVTKLDINQEARYKFQAERLKKFDAQIAKQKGLGWIFEALCGGDLSNIDPLWFYNQNDEDFENKSASTALRIKNINAKLQVKKPIIVGHNILLDLAFLFKTFVGPLPPCVEEFQDEIHKLFPSVIDTKFLATHHLQYTQSRSSLKEVLEPLQKIQNPIVLLHEEHRPSHYNLGKHHEAGFDSWMTAELFVKLSTKLIADQKILEDVNGSDSSAYRSDVAIRSTSAVVGDATIGTDVSKPVQNQASSGLSDQKAAILLDIADPLISENPYDVHVTNESGDKERLIEPNQWLPEFSDDFWKTYLNKLRVNSIESCVCDLAWRDTIVNNNPMRKKPRLT